MKDEGPVSREQVSLAKLNNSARRRFVPRGKREACWVPPASPSMLPSSVT